MDLRCTGCDSAYYTAARFTRELTCTKCGARLLAVSDRTRALIEAGEAPPPVRPAEDPVRAP